MKIFEKVPDEVVERIERLMKKFHPALIKAEVRVTGLFCRHEDDPDKPAVSHHGRPAKAVIQSVNAKNRAAGLADVIIEIDKTRYIKDSERRRDALIAHELYHLVLVPDKLDGAGRPKIKMREHDYDFGWFDEIAKRFGQDSPEVIQARQLLHEAGQLYFDLPQLPGPKITKEDLAAAGGRG